MFAPPGSTLKRAGASNLALEMKRYQKRQMEDLEKELARSRRIVDETTRVVAAKREEIDLLRKQAMVLNDEFLRRSNELDRSKMQLAIMLEQANQIVKAKQYIAEQMEELKAESNRDRDAWMSQRDDIIREVRAIVESLQSDTATSPKAATSSRRGDGGADGLNWGDLDPEAEQRAQERVKELTAEIARLEAAAPIEAAELEAWEAAFARLSALTGEGGIEELVGQYLAEDEVSFAIYNEIATLNDEADQVQATIATLAHDTEAAKDAAREAKDAVLNEVRRKLHAVEAAADDSAERERILVAQLRVVSSRIVELYRVLK